MSKSVKINQLKNGGPTFVCNLGERFYKVWYNFETETYWMNWGTDGLGVDGRDEYETIEETEREMRKIANLRHWVYCTEF